MIFTTVSSTPSLMLITLSLLLLTLIRSSFRSLDSTIPTPFLPCLFAPLRINLHPPPNYFALSPFHLVSCTHNTPTFLLSIRSANSLPLPVIDPTFNVPTLTRTSFFNWARPCPSSPCPLITGSRRIPCASPTGNALAVFEARCLISLIIGFWLGFYDRMPFLTSTTVVSGGPNR